MYRIYIHRHVVADLDIKLGWSELGRGAVRHFRLFYRPIGVISGKVMCTAQCLKMLGRTSIL